MHHRFKHHRQKMAKMQALLYAEKKRSVLVVLQALDAAGKDGTITRELPSHHECHHQTGKSDHNDHCRRKPPSRR
jgi:Polyphosphate kinase 2 (PPK2)